MDKSTIRRRSVLAAALLGTVAAIVYPQDDDGTVGYVSAPPTQGGRAVAPPTVHVMETPLAEEAGTDPFALPGWMAPAKPAEAVVPVAVVAPPVQAPAPLEPAGLPPLPFKYVGRFSDEGGGVVYVAHGDSALVVRLGDVIDNAYKVVAVDDRSVEFEYMATGTRQTLSLPLVEQ